MDEREREILQEVIGLIENLQGRVMALEGASKEWPPENEKCANCGQWLGGPVQCCDDPASPSEGEKHGD